MSIENNFCHSCYVPYTLEDEKRPYYCKVCETGDLNAICKRQIQNIDKIAIEHLVHVLRRAREKLDAELDLDEFGPSAKLSYKSFSSEVQNIMTAMPKHKSLGLGLTWPTKDQWESPEARILVEKEVFHSEKKGLSENLLIHGDNLLGLAALEKKYAEKVKCIYIDPPYNTKSCFTHYDDSFEHSLWLDMMKERLKILHRLLRKDGTIWISIDDDECHYLKVLCDEIFGRKNFVANVIWEKKYSPQNDAKWLSDSHDHVLVYAKCIDLKHWGKDVKKGLNLLPRTEEMDKRYKNPDNDPRGLWMSDNLSVKRITPKDIYPIQTPSGKDVMPPPGTSWRLSKEKLKEYIDDNRIWFGPNGTNTPRLKRFLSEVQDGIVSKTIWPRTEVGDNQEAKREVIAFNSKDVFSTPKPERLIQRILYLATDPGDIVLDCFAGSGTTGAVAHKMKRHWIMIEMGMHAETHIIPRLQKVIEGTDPGGITSQVEWKGGGGFQLLKLPEAEGGES